MTTTPETEYSALILEEYGHLIQRAPGSIFTPAQLTQFHLWLHLGEPYRGIAIAALGADLSPSNARN